MSIEPSHLLIVLYLVFLEGLLSFDNALALAALVSKRLTDPKDQRHALLWGMWGAYIFRIGMILLGLRVMDYCVACDWGFLRERHWGTFNVYPVRLVAALYLIWLAITELWPEKDPVRHMGEEFFNAQASEKDTRL